MPTPIDPRRLRAIIGGSAGNLVEWYDWFAYAGLAIYFAPLFFPKGDPTAQLLSAAAIFAVGFLMRPLGAIIHGAYIDDVGRRKGLIVTLSIMASDTILIAFVPGYATIGLFAPALVLFGRLLQGF